jgi:hypothetical protein
VREPAGKDNNRQQVRPDRQVQRLPEVHRVPVQRAPVVRPEGNRAERSSSPDRGFRQAAPHQDSHRDSGGARSGGRRR